MIYDIEIDGASHRIELLWEKRGLRCKLNGEFFNADVYWPEPDTISILIGEQPYEIRFDRRPGGNSIVVSHANASARFDFAIRDPRALRGKTGAAADSEGS